MIVSAVFKGLSFFTTIIKSDMIEGKSKHVI